MTSLADIRAKIVSLALADNGYLDGVGYPGPINKYNIHCGRGQEYCCADGVSTWLDLAGLPLPVVQAKVGLAYVPYAANLAHQMDAVINSWEAEPGDPVIFGWSPNSTGDHIGVAIYWKNGVLRTVETDSGPSNVDGYRGEGGTHTHDWPAPAGVGNDNIMLVFSLKKLYARTYTQPTTTAAPAPAAPAEDPWKATMSSPMPPALQQALDTITKALAQTQDTAAKALAAASGSQLLRVNGPTTTGPGGEGEPADAQGNPGRGYAIWDVAFTVLPDGTVVGTKYPVLPGFENVGAPGEAPPAPRPVTAGFLAALKTAAV